MLVLLFQGGEGGARLNFWGGGVLLPRSRGHHTCGNNLGHFHGVLRKVAPSNPTKYGVGGVCPRNIAPTTAQKSIGVGPPLEGEIFGKQIVGAVLHWHAIGLGIACKVCNVCNAHASSCI